jgi:hypothetical protein
MTVRKSKDLTILLASLPSKLSKWLRHLLEGAKNGLVITILRRILTFRTC